MNERTTVRLPGELLARAKRKAAAEGRTLTSLIEDGLRAVMTETNKPEYSRRVVLPVSSATGGPWSGIDISNSSKLHEMDDLESVKRVKLLR